MKKGPSQYNSVEFGPDRLQQLRVEEVLTQAEGAPVASAHAAQPGVAEERHGEGKRQRTVYIEKQTRGGKGRSVKRSHHHDVSSFGLITWEPEQIKDNENRFRPQ